MVEGSKWGPIDPPRAPPGGPVGPRFLSVTRVPTEVTKRYNEYIEVTTDANGRAPVAFNWRGRRYFVDQYLASWRVSEPTLGWGYFEYYRVLAHPEGTAATGDIDSDGFLVTRGAGVGGLEDRIGAVYDVRCFTESGDWKLVRMWD